MSIECRHIRPGDPGFEELARQITPLHKIRKGFSQVKGNGITADTAPLPKNRRHGDVNKLR